MRSRKKSKRIDGASVKIATGLMNDPEIVSLSDDEYKRLFSAAVRGEPNVFSKWMVHDVAGPGAEMFGEDTIQ